MGCDSFEMAYVTLIGKVFEKAGESGMKVLGGKCCLEGDGAAHVIPELKSEGLGRF